jgi:hypothetical protein
MKIHSVGAEFFHVDRQTDRQIDIMKLVDAFLNFPKALKNSVFCLHVAILRFVCLIEQTAIISLYSMTWFL